MRAINGGPRGRRRDRQRWSGDPGVRPPGGGDRVRPGRARGLSAGADGGATAGPGSRGCQPLPFGILGILRGVGILRRLPSEAEECQQFLKWQPSGGLAFFGRKSPHPPALEAVLFGDHPDFLASPRWRVPRVSSRAPVHVPRHPSRSLARGAQLVAQKVLCLGRRSAVAAAWASVAWKAWSAEIVTGSLSQATDDPTMALPGSPTSRCSSRKARPCRGGPGYS